MLTSLDPRVNRLNIPEEFDQPFISPVNLDQFETYQSFVQVKEGKPFEHAGIVHAPNEEMALLFAKEQYSRRGMICQALGVIKTENIKASPFTENAQNVYDLFEGTFSGNEAESFELFHLMKRGKQHKHANSVMAKDYNDAILAAKSEFMEGKPVLNIWIVKTADILATDEEDKDIWDTLHEKKYRDAIDYKAADKIKAYKEQQGT